MERMTVAEALTICKDFSQTNKIERSVRFWPVKRLEQAAGAPLLRRQRIFNGAVITALQSLAESAKRADALADGRLEDSARADGIAELRRDLVAVQQQLAALDAKIDELRAAPPRAQAG